MDIDALRTFLAFVDTGSFTRAAQQVCRTQSAVSMQMKKLESDVANPLFVKQGRQLVLSNAGIQLASYAKQLIALHDEAYKQLKTSAGQVRIRLGCPDDYALSILPKITELLHQLIEQLDLQITCASTTELKNQLDQGLLDLIIATRSPSSEEGYFLHASSGVWVKSKEFSYHRDMTLPIAIFMRDCKFHQAAIEGLLKTERQFKVIGCCSSLSALDALVKNHLAIGAIAEISKAESLIIIDDPSLPALPAVDIVLLLANHTHNPISQTMVKQLAEQFVNQDKLVKPPA
ncbi:LysR family transcriptional regulator [Psychromonas sp. 14N.309.X.WAT.B.A12]|uniref:LysR family transcriptional regulator n=1 Tax=Psychromonas sp. 14N.309.X.WAT.B.A12 TaxID=2998322 RepID=UPI0025B0AA9B|nr:LysR family transcriptional regulator [Psychromonas sp. 14N.309.X.WAT.B.A12]MDN2662509.1 LysR family transcriptional regulator [Psychromonas sp. 14N.309.X.WAT.B.A12]